MAYFRTPSSIFHSGISFISQGELLDGDVGSLNRAAFSLNDNDQYLKDTQDIERDRGSALASVLGELYDSTVVSPTWNTPTYFAQGSSHHTAIEALDQNLSALAAGTDLTRVDNLDTFILGEDSTTGQPPDWSTARTPFVIQLGDSHHDALNRLDISASSLTATATQLDTRVSTLESQVATVIVDLAAAEAAISAQQTELNNVSTLAFANDSQITTQASRLVVTRTAVSTVASELNLVSTVADTNSCVIEKMKSQINVLRNQHALAPIATWCP